MNYYNEYDAKTAAWLRGLIAAGLIPAGDVDERSITDILPGDLAGYTQCHFFAGIGGWSLALQLAGWPADRRVWTGSCPCQPFSVAGKGKGSDDERHLWPVFFRLISECRPDVVFGEQVESAIGHGWLDGIRADLEGEGYACGDATLGAHSVGAPHQRQRLYWMAVAEGSRRQAAGMRPEINSGRESQPGRASGGMADSTGDREQSMHGGCDSGGGILLDGAESRGHGGDGRAVDFWTDSRWIDCRDGKRRRIPTEPRLFPLADGIPYRLARRGSVRAPLLRGAGNAIVPQVAAAFIAAGIEAMEQGY